MGLLLLFSPNSKDAVWFLVIIVQKLILVILIRMFPCRIIKRIHLFSAQFFSTLIISFWSALKNLFAEDVLVLHLLDGLILGNL